MILAKIRRDRVDIWCCSAYALIVLALYKPSTNCNTVFSGSNFRSSKWCGIRTFSDKGFLD